MHLDFFFILSVALVKFTASHYMVVLPTFWSIMELFHFIKKGLMVRKNEIKDIAASIWHLFVAANSAWTSLDDIIRCIALLEKSHISIHFCHGY